jgi:hypothetical protein
VHRFSPIISATVCWHAAPPINGDAYNESDWNNDSDLEHPYALSKVNRAILTPCACCAAHCESRGDLFSVSHLAHGQQPALLLPTPCSTGRHPNACQPTLQFCCIMHAQALAEKAAWQVVKKDNIDLVVINPVGRYLCIAKHMYAGCTASRLLFSQQWSQWTSAARGSNSIWIDACPKMRLTEAFAHGRCS